MATTQTAESELEPGDSIEIEFLSVAGRSRERKSMDVEVEGVMGQILYLDPGYDIDVGLVLDPDGDLWARDEQGKDGLYGTRSKVQGDVWACKE
ncbi:hypothetical protein ACFQDD_08055 [Halorubrum pallidum]|uniref:Uncharacterized protein n=1 Tax=Halorubrum pallidum TaxID=1526114 RepID=A0ABD5T1W8_9EURY